MRKLGKYCVRKDSIADRVYNGFGSITDFFKNGVNWELLENVLPKGLGATLIITVLIILSLIMAHQMGEMAALRKLGAL